MTVAAHNLSMLMRKLFRVGKPRVLQGAREASLEIPSLFGVFGNGYQGIPRKSLGDFEFFSFFGKKAGRLRLIKG